jgi:hypothetical protein
MVSFRPEPGVTEKVSAAVAVCAGGPASVILTVKFEFPDAAGAFPVIFPDVSSATPLGRAPEITAQVKGPVPPFAANCMLTAVFSTTGGRVEVEILSTSAT